MDYRDATDRLRVQHDLHFGHAMNFGEYISIRDLANEPLYGAWYAFQSTIESLLAMVLLPNAIISNAVSHLLQLSQAVFNVLGKPVMCDEDVIPHQQAIADEFDRIHAGFFDGRTLVWDRLCMDTIVRNRVNVENSPTTKPGYYAILEAQVIGVWTAFDAMTTDACIAAVNLEPRALYGIEKKQIALESLLDAALNQTLGDNLGELVRLFVHMDSHKSKAEAFRQLFKSEEINEAMGDTAVQTALLVRNQLIHNAGIANEAFVEQAKKLEAPYWGLLRAGERLPLDGYHVAGLAQNLVDCANRLIRALDDWLGPPAKRAAKSPNQEA